MSDRMGNYGRDRYRTGIVVFLRLTPANLKHTNPMNHMQNIVTNARQGKPLSARNRRRRSNLGRPALAMLVVAFWVVAAVAILAILA